MNEKKQIKVTDVIAMLENGMTRSEINEHYGLNPREVKLLWSHPKLINRKPSKYKIGISIVDDEEVLTPTKIPLTNIPEEHVSEKDIPEVPEVPQTKPSVEEIKENMDNKREAYSDTF